MLEDYLEPIVTFPCIVYVLLNLSLMDELVLQEKKHISIITNAALIQGMPLL